MTQFEECYTKAINAIHIPQRGLQPGECQTPYGKRCSLCHAVTLDYNEELRIKNEALKEFWKRNTLSIQLDPIVPSPRGRSYQTVTKRKVFPSRGKARLGLIGTSKDSDVHANAIDVVHCAVEPETHARVYTRVQKILETSKDSHLADALNYVVVKGSYTELTVILNVNTIEPAVLKKINALSKSLTASVNEVSGVFLYHDEKRSRFYLSSSEGEEQSFRRVYGKKEIYQKILGKSFLYSPLSFSHVNQSMVEELVGRVESMIVPQRDVHLYDLYCGYGLFALSLAGKVASVTGVDLSSASVEAAKANALRQHEQHARFLRRDITQESMEALLQKAPERFSVILDPPRGGTAQGVIEAIGARRPEGAVHIFCEIDLIPLELARWKKAGYHPGKAVALDMLPGTDEVEVVVSLRRY